MPDENKENTEWTMKRGISNLLCFFSLAFGISGKALLSSPNNGALVLAPRGRHVVNRVLRVIRVAL